MRTNHTATNPRVGPQRGFTLVEMMVVVVIILILLGIGVAVGPAIIGKGDTQVTEVTMRKLRTVNDRYETLTGTQVQLDPRAEWAATDPPNNPDGSGRAPYRWYFKNSLWYSWLSIEYFLDTAKESPKVAKFITERSTDLNLTDSSSQVALPWSSTQSTGDYKTYAENESPRLFNNTKGGNDLHEVLDPWGQPYIYKSMHVGRAGLWDSPDTAGMASNDFIEPIKNGPYFVSAGPDGLIGNINAPMDTDAFEATKDNIYSHDLIGLDR